MNLPWVTMEKNGWLNRDKDNLSSHLVLATMGGGMASNLLKAGYERHVRRRYSGGG